MSRQLSAGFDSCLVLVLVISEAVIVIGFYAFFEYITITVRRCLTDYDYDIKTDWWGIAHPTNHQITLPSS
jgi:hypothetical protein